MKLTVFGAGAVGGQIAARLALSGVAVSVVARGAHLQAIQQHGLTFEIEGERRIAQVKATADSASLGPQDIVIVSVKSTGLVAALPSLSPLIGPETKVIFAMNGLPWWFADDMATQVATPLRKLLDADGTLAALIPAERIIWCVVLSAGTVPEPGVVKSTSPKRNELTLGYPDGREDDAIAAIAAKLAAAGYTAIVSTDIRRDIWNKLLVNAGLAIVSTLSERNNLDTVSDPETRALAIDCMQEILATGRSIGIDLQADPAAITDPARIAPHRSSILQDLQAGRVLEINNILGVREIARAKGVAIPSLTAIAALITARSDVNRKKLEG